MNIRNAILSCRTWCVIGLLILAACGAKHEGGADVAVSAENMKMMDAAASPPAAEPAPQPSATGANPSAPLERKMIYTAQLRMQVEQLDEAARKVKALVQRVDGYYTNEAHQSEYGAKTVKFVLRVPQAGFESTLAEIEKLGVFMQEKTISSNDVTEAYYDTGIRLEGKRAALKQYYQILQRAGAIKDVLEVQARINELEADIESLEGRIRYLSNQVQYTTIDLTLYVPVPLDEHRPRNPETSFLVQLKTAFTQGADAIKITFLGLVTLWPFLLGGGVIFWLWRRWRKKRRNAAEQAAN